MDVIINEYHRVTCLPLSPVVVYIKARVLGLSEKNKKQLVYEGYIFNQQQNPTNSQKQYWICKEFFTRKCLARCHTIENQVILHQVIQRL